MVKRTTKKVLTKLEWLCIDLSAWLNTMAQWLKRKRWEIEK